MKKLMFAAVAAMTAGFSFAADCGCEDKCTTKCVYAYEVILLAKTTAGKPTGTVVEDTCGCTSTVCNDGCYRKPLMRKFAGFVYGQAPEDTTATCSSGCGCLDFTAFDGQVFWDVNTRKLVDATLEFSQIDAIGYQSKETVEAVGTFTLKEGCTDTAEGVLTLAGFGKRGRRANGAIMLKNLSGFFAGTLPCLCKGETAGATPCDDPECSSTIAMAWGLCDDAPVDFGGQTAAYGKWQLKWNETAAQRLTKNYSAGAKALTKNGYEMPEVAE